MANSTYIQKSLVFKPKIFYVYKLVSVDESPLIINRDRLFNNNKGVLFSVYKNEKRINDANEIMLLHIDFNLKKTLY